MKKHFILKHNLILWLLVFFSNCNNSSKQVSYWQLQKDNFKFRDLKRFEVDNLKREDLKTLKQTNKNILRSILDTPLLYLYSWQERDKTKNEFSVVEDRDEHGLAIYYVITDKSDSVISATQVAGRGSEEAYWFETKSNFLNKDTILRIGSITKHYNNFKRQNLDKPIGDTTFSYLIINPDGKVTEKLFKEVKTLHFENE